MSETQPLPPSQPLAPSQRKPRGRPRLAPHDQTSRKALIRAGLAQLTERGYVAVRIDDIVAQAGVTKGAFYHHFSGKPAYGAALIDEYDTYFLARIAQSLCRTDLRPLQRLANFAAQAEAGMARHDFRRGCLIGNLGQEMASLPPEYRARLIAVLQGWQALTTDCLRAAQDAGHIAPEHDPDALSALFWTGWEGAVLRAKLERTPIPLRAFASGFLHLIANDRRPS